MTETSVMLTRKEAAKLIGVHPNTLAKLDSGHDGPPFVRSGDAKNAKFLYPICLLGDWIAAKARGQKQ